LIHVQRCPVVEKVVLVARADRPKAGRPRGALPRYPVILESACRT
jgi:hypothetical protein